uniref:Uncharacterized protein n=1 Tax=Anguilla anguilla TaxID=7936 RepID=A0A0E9UUT2_ANGAN
MLVHTPGATACHPPPPQSTSKCDNFTRQVSRNLGREKDTGICPFHTAIQFHSVAQHWRAPTGGISWWPLKRST